MSDPLEIKMLNVWPDIWGHPTSPIAPLPEGEYSPQPSVVFTPAPAQGSRRTIVFLSGPMTGIEAWNFPAFDAARDHLEAAGYKVISPADMDRDVGFDPSTGCASDFDLEAAIRRDVEAILECDVIAMLPGHEKSRGASSEMAVAKWAGKQVLVYPAMTPWVEPYRPVAPVEAAGGLADGTMVTAENGAKQSFVAARFDCIPPEVLRLLAQGLGYGCRRYGKSNWRGIPIDDNLNHAMNHINEFNRGDTSEPHLVNALMRVTFALSLAVEQGLQAEDYIHPEMLAAQ